MSIIITGRFNKQVLNQPLGSFRFISFRALSRKEVSLVRSIGLKRFYLPPFTKEESDNFFFEFDKFWDEILLNFNSQHNFWRNAVSSKMQEWEKSVGYFCMVLFALHKMKNSQMDLILICDTVQMETACIKWAKKYGWDVIGDDSLWHRIAMRFMQEMKNGRSFFLRLSFTIYKKILLIGLKNKKDTGEPKVLISSLFYKDSFKSGQYKDPVFGSLHAHIKKEGLNCVYLCEGLNAFDRNTVKAALHCRDVQIYTPLLLITFWQIVTIFAKLYSRRIRIPTVRYMGVDFTSVIKSNLNSFNDSFNVNSEFFFFATLKLCKRYDFQQLICNFEGNVHERACIQAFRKCNGGKIIGYSQAILFPLNLKLRLTNQECFLKPEPDVFVCTGPYAKELLQRMGSRRPEVFRQGCILRNLPAVASHQNLQNSRKILIVFDGMASTAILLDWILEQSSRLQDFEVHLRFHPNMPACRVLNQITFSLPSNFRISENDILEDMNKSVCVFYRHSSVGILAILNGIPAVYLNIDSPLSGDPIAELSAYKWVVASAVEMTNTIVAIQARNKQEDKKLLLQARRFINRYFSELTETELESFIN